MGGMGSGRHFQFGADTTNSYRSIDVRRWKRDDLLGAGQAFGWNWSRDDEVFASIRVKTEPGRVVLTYRHRSGGGEWQDESYPVYLDATRCHLGGERQWFLCPARGCGKRVAVLYGGGIFACRHCYRLAYPSQRENLSDRAARRADRIRDKMGWEPGILNGIGRKPKGMHWRTFDRLVSQHEEHTKTSIGAMMARFGGLRP